MSTTVIRSLLVRTLGTSLLLAGLLAMTRATADPMRSATPEELVQRTSEQVLAVLNSEDADLLRSNPARLNEIVYNIILPVIDFEAFAKLTLGRYWRTASPTQRKRFVEAFESNLVRTYTKYLADYGGTTIQILPSRGNPDDRRRTVNAEVRVPGEQPMAVQYSFWKTQGQWKAYNITIEGLSLVQLFRTDFAARVEQDGLDALIERLNTSSEELISDEKIKAPPG